MLSSSDHRYGVCRDLIDRLSSGEVEEMRTGQVEFLA